LETSTSGSSKSIAKRFGTDHDDVLYFTKSDSYSFYPTYLEYPEEEVKKNVLDKVMIAEGIRMLNSQPIQKNF